jgi:hypothetical protein
VTPRFSFFWKDGTITSADAKTEAEAMTLLHITDLSQLDSIGITTTDAEQEQERKWRIAEEAEKEYYRHRWPWGGWRKRG